MNKFSIKQLKTHTKSVGQTLRRARQRLEHSFEQVEHDTAIRIRYLEALEQDNFAELPSSVYAIGFVRKYATYLGLKPDKLLHQFKTDLAIWKSKHIGTLSPLKTIEEPKLFITPKLVGAVIGVLSIMMLFGYIWYQVRFVTAAPELVVTTPSHNVTTQAASIQILGKTLSAATLKINDELVTQDKDGNFTQQIALRDGVNVISIIAANRFDKQSSKVIQVLKTGS